MRRILMDLPARRWLATAEARWICPLAVGSLRRTRARVLRRLLRARVYDHGERADPSDRTLRGVRIALAQINPTVGDLAGNRRLVEEYAAKAAAAGAQLAVFPELALTGYPPLDLLERRGFVEDQLRELEALAPASQRIAIAVGAVLPAERRGGKSLANAAVLLAGGARIAAQAKTHLPTYDVFDEKRHFAPASACTPAVLGGVALGLTICEDGWAQQVPYEVDPTGELARSGVALVLNLSASPWHVGKPRARRELFAALARRHGVPIAFCNQVGGNDELTFDGGSFFVDARGELRAVLPLFEPALELIDTGALSPAIAEAAVDEPVAAAQLEAGLVLGIRDYFRKQSLPPGAVIGLSGGVDSAVTAHLAALALGADRVLGVLMPGPFSSDHSVADAAALARNLGIETRTVDIRPIYERYLESLPSVFGPAHEARHDDRSAEARFPRSEPKASGEVTKLARSEPKASGEIHKVGLAQQNIQSRIRGATLMAISNAENRLVLATGNKSELSIGYCTLYGDTVGGIAVLGDVYKRDVYALARHANRHGERIPAHTIDKPPSAELAPNQRDEDDLPPYAILDAVLEQAIEGGRNAESIEPPPGATRELVRQIVRRLDRNEYKRRQSPLVLRTSPKAFGSGRRLPIVHRYDGELRAGSPGMTAR
ncbi:MAG: NAD(+) synthase [Proteobacteria bacterium]|nr:MAG: NAD(+) synthase [Pseudomonadota bacterium]